MIFAFAFMLSISGFGSTTQARSLQFYPNGELTWVGDPIPYFDGKNFQIFYLDDLRDGASGYHPWSLYTTNNFTEYKDEGIVIPYGVSPSAQDHALGTGSVIRGPGGQYYAFYTGHNDDTKTEAVMEAVSTDLKHWSKLPENTFYPSDGYSQIDFRDPDVVYIKNRDEYWMLVTTRKNNMGVIARYTSKDLKTWKDAGVFFSNDMGTDSNMECPTLMQYGSYWYLTFSDQGVSRLVHYRISAKPEGPFKAPAADTFDGNGFYAGKTVTDSKNLYMFGWVPTRIDYDDSKAYNWAGSLVVHQLKQQKDGTLVCSAPDNLIKTLNRTEKLSFVSKSATVSKKGDLFRFSGKKFEYVQFAPWKGSIKITGIINSGAGKGIVGLSFNQQKNGKSGLNYKLDFRKQWLSFYNTCTDDLQSVQAESSETLQLKPNTKYSFILLADNSTAVLYVGKRAMSARMFMMPRKPWGLYSMGSTTSFENLKIWN